MLNQRKEETEIQWLKHKNNFFVPYCSAKGYDIYFSSVMHFIIQLLLLPIGFLLWIRNRE